MVITTRVIGNMVSYMAKASILSLMVNAMRVSLKMAKDMAEALRFILMENDRWTIGKMINKYRIGQVGFSDVKSRLFKNTRSKLNSSECLAGRVNIL